MRCSMKVRRALLGLTLGMLVAAPGVRAQCDGTWLPGQGVPGVNGIVNTQTVWDPDGPGPLPALLVVGGSFTLPGAAQANSIAAWGGTAWHALGRGAPPHATRPPLAPYQGPA